MPIKPTKKFLNLNMSLAVAMFFYLIFQPDYICLNTTSNNIKVSIDKQSNGAHWLP
jgi:hypothetical protein